MKKYSIYWLTLAASLFIAVSCESDNDNSQENWMVDNQQAFNAIKSNSEYKEIKSPGNEGSIYYKVLHQGDGQEPIYYTSQVGIYSKGWFVASYEKYGIKNGAEFQHWLFENGAPYYIQISSTSSNNYLLRGLKVALQNMKEGDKWEVWVPYQLGYGSTESTIMYDWGMLASSYTKIPIPPYSVLVFELEVVKVHKD